MIEKIKEMWNQLIVNIKYWANNLKQWFIKVWATTKLYFKWLGSQFKKLWQMITGKEVDS